MGWIKDLIWGRKVLFDKSLWKDNRVMAWCIYGSKLKVCDFAKHFSRFHRTFKYRLFVPILKLSELFVGKKIPSEPRKEWHDDKLNAFNRAWDKSIYEWGKYYFYKLNDDLPLPPSEKEMEHFIKTRPCVKLLNSIKRLAMIGLLWDTGYREFYNVFSLNFTVEMNKLAGKDNKYRHLFYREPHIEDVLYYAIGKEMANSPRMLMFLNRLEKGGAKK